MEHELSGVRTDPFFPNCLPLEALQQADDRLFTGIETRDVTDHEPEETKKNILCRTCGNAITSDEDGIAMNGSHEHTFMNPRGIVFRIGCFSRAGGCHVMGPATSEYTWFPGFAWCYVICAGCNSHLGWRYQSGENMFFGLILDHLVRQ